MFAVLSRFCSSLKSENFSRIVPKRHVKIQPRAAKPIARATSVDYYDETNMAKRRPMSPHLTIYAYEIQGMMSISNRISGAIWTAEVFTFAVCTIVLPESVDYYVAKINSWGLDPFVIFIGKCLVAWPAVYHTVDGIRHTLWDFGFPLNNKVTISTGYAVLLICVLATLYLSY